MLVRSLIVSVMVSIIDIPSLKLFSSSFFLYQTISIINNQTVSTTLKSSLANPH